MKSRLKILGILCLFIPNYIWCQEVKTTRDIGLWASVGVNYELNKKWHTKLIQEVRSFDNAIKFQKSITDLGLTYKINKQFKLGTGLRYTYDRKKDYTFTNDIRYNIDFKFKHKLTNHFSLYYRFRFQHSYINLFTYITDIDQKSNARNRIKIEFALKKHAVYLSAELFREYAVYKKPTFNNLRLCIGDQLKTGLGNFKYGLAFERALNETHPLNFYFLKLNYTFNLKHD